MKSIQIKYRIGDQVQMKNNKAATGVVEAVEVRYSRHKGELEKLNIDYLVNWERPNMGPQRWYAEEDLASPWPWEKN